MPGTGDATYDHVTRTLQGADYSIEFTKYEGVIFGLLWKVRSTGHLVTRERIVDALYGHDPNGGPNTERKVIDVLLHNIRRRLRDGGADFVIITRREVGYRLSRLKPKGEPPVAAIPPREPAPLAPAVMEAA